MHKIEHGMHMESRIGHWPEETELRIAGAPISFYATVPSLFLIGNFKSRAYIPLFAFG